MDESTGKANREEARGVAGELDHLFRHESGQLVAALTRTLGLRHLALAEDVVQDTLADALEAWKFQGMPSNPSGWLYRVARNKAIDNLRHDQRLQALADRIGWHQENQLSQASPTESERREDAISLLFALCHPALSQTSQIALLLKTLGGFSIVEISRAFLMPEASVAKRLYRARETLKTQSRELDLPQGEVLSERLDAVRTALYLLFNEGCHASHSETAIRKDLCHEALRLALLLHGHPMGAQAETAALIALMALHASRFEARLSDDGALLLLDEQDRGLWDQSLIREGFHYLDLASEGEHFTRYAIEAAIAAQHAMANNTASTNWAALLTLYDALLLEIPSPIVALNRALVISRLAGPGPGLAAIHAIPDRTRLESYHYYHAALGELRAALGDSGVAREHYNAALQLATNRAEKDLLVRKLHALKPSK